MSYIEKSPWVIHYDGCGCNGCAMEIMACQAPVYDMERFGILLTDNPRHADILLVTGAIDETDKEELIRIYERMVEPKAVIAAGACACGGGIFEECSDILGGADTVIPVDVYIPGCAVRPDAVIDGILKSLDVFGGSVKAEDLPESDDGAEPENDAEPEAENDDPEESIQENDSDDDEREEDEK